MSAAVPGYCAGRFADEPSFGTWPAFMSSDDGAAVALLPLEVCACPAYPSAEASGKYFNTKFGGMCY